MVKYNTNWMGPINYDWLEMYGKDWAGGRIDVRGLEENEELYLPLMKVGDYGRFSEWLYDFQTETLWTLASLVDEYEKSHSPIIWWANDLVERGYLNERTNSRAG